jgi:putative ATP-binding cassette transporter
MPFLELIRRESGDSMRRVPWIAALAGLANALVLAVINTAAQHAEDGVADFRFLVMFGCALALYAGSQHYIMTTSTREMETVLHRLRSRIADKIRHADLQPMEKLGRAEVYAGISKSSQVLSQAAALIAVGCQAGLLIAFTLIYIGWLSLYALGLFVLCFGVALALYFWEMRAVRSCLQESTEKDNQTFELISGLLDGFKEVKMNRRRSDDLFRHVQEVSRAAADLKTRLQAKHSVMYIFTQTTFYLLVAAMVFLLPRLNPTYSEVVIKSVAAILFILGPISTFVGAIPVLDNANNTAENIMRLEAKLAQAEAEGESPPSDRFRNFQRITVEGIGFTYRDEAGRPSFEVGPVDLEIRRGEILFLSGGNGSGKSTLVKLLTALYHPDRGRIRVDGETVDPRSVADYRELFSTIFTDYHLFRRLYGIEDGRERGRQLIEEFELASATHFTDDGFSHLDLSTGQKKRLALLVSILEDKPIHVFDEWAADQDPIFRRKFYREILPELKRQGKTVIAVTHDDHYFDAADRRLQMDGGQLESARS